MNNLPNLYLKGTFNGWGLDTPFTQLSAEQYSACVVFSADQHRFKITDMDGSEQWTLSGHEIDPTTVELNQTTPLLTTHGIGNDLLFTPNATGRFTLLLDLSDGAPSLTIQTGGDNQQTLSKRDRLCARLNSVSAPASDILCAEGALEPSTLFDALAIENDDSFPFVFGDNVDGYYEGRTHQFVSAGRYRHHQGWYLGGFASWVDGELNIKPSALKARLLPYGIEHQFHNAKDLLSLHQAHRMASLTVSTNKAKPLSVLPELNVGVNDVSVEIEGDVIVLAINAELCPEGSPRYIAISANQPVIIEEVSSTQFPELEQHLFLSGSHCQLMISSVQPSVELTAYLCFEHSKAKAIEHCRQAAQHNALQQHKTRIYQFLTHNYLWTDDLEYNRAVMWARLSSRVFVSHEFGTGIWAGLPWFKDCWGRDTFIALSGTSLVNGEFEEAKSIIENFASMQQLDTQSVNYGRIPNRVTSKTNIIYNTTDGTPWMIREILEYINYSGDKALAKRIYPVIQRFISGVETHYLDADGLMKHRHPDTWMDAKINGQTPWSPRGPKANDIQALWFESLNVAKQVALLNNDQTFAEHVDTLAKHAKQSFIEKFWDEEHLQLADRLEENDRPDFSVRPNQLMAMTIPQQESLIAPSIGQHMVKNCVDNLLFPWGICSLNQQHADFHPYHDNRSEYHKDAAYHNGTIWGWNAGFTVSALNRYHQQDFAYQLSKNLARQILQQGHRGTMSENLDAFQTHPQQLVETGTYAQAWSVSEFARNAQQDYLGFKPKLIANSIELAPKIPSQWQSFKARLLFGENNALQFEYQRDAQGYRFQLTPAVLKADIHLDLKFLVGNNVIAVASDLSSPLTLHIDLSGNCTYISSPANVKQVENEYRWELEKLAFASPDNSVHFASLNERDYLFNKRKTEGLQQDRDAI